MRNISVQRCRSWDGLEGSSKPTLSFDTDEDTVWLHLSDQLVRLNTDLSIPIKDQRIQLSFADDVPRDMVLISLQALPGGDFVMIGRAGEMVKCSPKGSCELIGKIPDGILAAEWSPSLDLLALVTGKDVLLLMTPDFDVVREGPVASTADGDRFVNVGWGKKETQFHGTAGKAAARVESVSMKRASGDLGIPSIAWRGDGQFFAVSHIDSSTDARRIRVFDQFGQFQSISEPVGQLEGCLAWIPNGSLLASTAIHPDGRRQVVFFERNGLRHGEFFLRTDTPVVELSWNSQSNLLSILYEDGTVEIWTSKNYHWYLKMSLPGKYASFRWWTLLRPYTATAIDIGGRVEVIEFGWSYARSQADVTDKLSIVAVIDGTDVLLIPFALANVAPPLSFTKFTCEFVPESVAVHAIPAKKEFLLALSHGNQLSLIQGVIDQTCKFTPLGQLTEQANIRMATLTSDYIVTQQVNGQVSIYSHGLELYARLDLPSEALLTSCGRYVQCYDGRLITLSDTGLTLSYGRGFADQTISFDSHIVSLHNGTALVNGHELVSGCAFLYQTPDFVIIGLAAEKSLRFLPKSVDPSEWSNMLSASGEESTRRMEAGSEIVIASMTSASLVLQAPRGNLETVYPRALVLASVRSSLASLDYRKAYMDCRRHRIDLNILYDAAPEAFIKTADMFIEQVRQTDYLNLFVASIRNEDTAQTKYPGFLKSNTGPMVEDKVNVVCKRIREVLLSRTDSDRFLETLMTTYVCQQPAQLDEALHAITTLATRHDADPEALDQSLTYLIFLVDVDRLFNVALGQYNLPLALSIARRSQKDPKEYVPFLEGLAELEQESVRRFRIDSYLSRHGKALRHYWDIIKGSTEAIGEFSFEGYLEYMKQHGLFKEALEMVTGPSSRSCIYSLFAESQLALGNHIGAASLYQLAEDIPKALEVCVEAGLWQQALSVSSVLPVDKQSSLIVGLLEQLMDQRRYQEAFNLAIRNSMNEAAFEAAVAGSLWLEALTIPDVDKDILMEEALKAADNYENEIDDIQTIFTEKSARLLLLQRQIINPPEHLSGPLMDISDNTSEMTFKTGGTRFTHASTTISTILSGTSTHRNKKKAERKMMKAKPGSPFERDGLRLILTEQIERVKRIHASITPLLVVLSENGEMRTASGIQKALIDLTTLISTFTTLFRSLQETIDMKVSKELSTSPIPVELLTPAVVSEEIVGRNAWHEAFKVSSEFTKNGWTLPYL